MPSSAKVIADSISPIGDRVTTLECVMHRFVLAEFNTHRAFSRNSASSRAIPVKKQLERVTTDPAIPLSWPAEQKGMQGGDELPIPAQHKAQLAWLHARNSAVSYVEELVNLGVHKSVTNRLLEPFMWHTVVVTSTEWENFFAQRCSPLAQPEIQAVAYAMRTAINNSEPQLLDYGQFHLPYMDEETRCTVMDNEKNWSQRLCSISAMRCARTSYLTQDGVRDYHVDLDGYQRLVEATPPHWSPLEHPCRPATEEELKRGVPGNLQGWVQLRHIVSGEF